MRLSMRCLLFTILLLVSANIRAQVPPVIQWQKCIGGTGSEGFSTILPTPDGGFIACGASTSNDGDMGVNQGYNDLFFMKLDVAGNIIWKRIYGGSWTEYTGGAGCLVATIDGGYIFVGSSGSSDGDVSGHHASPLGPAIPDVWIIKLDNNGFIQWQQSYGGPDYDYGFSIIQVSDGGYIVSGTTRGNGGDVLGYHGGTADDLWIFKINPAGILQWQKPFGGTADEGISSMTATSDGGFAISFHSNSHNGDITCPPVGFSDIIFTKFDNAGNIQWQKCHPDNFAGWIHMVRQTADGGYITVGNGWFSADPLPNLGIVRAFAEKLDANGNLQWHRDFDGRTGQEAFFTVYQMTDGSYILAGHTNSSDGDICVNRGIYEAFIVKLKGDGSPDWKKTYGGSMHDAASSIIPTNDGGFLFAGNTYSNNGDVSGNHNTESDAWLVKLNFPGIPVLPTINIVADKTSICASQSVRFIATITDGGTNPLFQWKINGVNTSVNNDTITINSFNNGDIVTCALTSNSPCVTNPNALSNAITITVDPLLVPRNFLSADTTICDYGTISLKATGNFDSYLWNTSATTPTITITAPGIYWLDVIKNGCPGTDSVVVTLKECLKGFYMPTAFTPNNDGKNDILKPKIAGVVLQYKFMIMNRWGQIVFQTTDLSKGWDGKLKGLLQDGNVYVWTCNYQLAGENLKQAKGTIVLIR